MERTMFRVLDLGRWNHRSQALVITPEEEECSKRSILDGVHFSNRNPAAYMSAEAGCFNARLWQMIPRCFI